VTQREADAVPSEAAFVELEQRRLASLVARDMATAESLHAAEYELVTPGGRPMTRADYLGGVARGELDYEVFEAVSEVRVRRSPGMAVVRYRARIVITWEGGRDEGVFWHTDTYERRADGWQAVWSHATRIRS
jgi:hypothetical protein